MLKVTYDERLGIVRVEGEGFYTMADEQRAAAATKSALAQCQAAHGDLKILILCASLVQDAQVMEAAAKRKSLTTGPHDRIAFICSSSLQKMQASRIFAAENAQCFMSENAAVTWLKADRVARVAVGAG